jgi:hypothetical protein
VKERRSRRRGRRRRTTTMTKTRRRKGKAAKHCAYYAQDIFCKDIEHTNFNIPNFKLHSTKIISFLSIFITNSKRIFNVFIKNFKDHRTM